jgi:hypothetical protein
VTEAWEYEALLATEVARTVTVEFAGITDGAVYNPAELTVPSAADPPGTPFTDQVTAVFALPDTVAMKVWLCDRVTLAEVGDTVTTTGGGGATSVITD